MSMPPPSTGKKIIGGAVVLVLLATFIMCPARKQRPATSPAEEQTSQTIRRTLEGNMAAVYAADAYFIMQVKNPSTGELEFITIWVRPDSHITIKGQPVGPDQVMPAHRAKAMVRLDRAADGRMLYTITSLEQ